MFEVNWSVIGTEPDSLPFYFDTWMGAKKFLENEIYHFGRNFEEYDEDVSCALNQLYDMINLTEGQDLTFTVGNISYWLLRLSDGFDDELKVFERYRL